jgi:hypothetical protein
MVQADGVALHSDRLPWWLFDMRPQGYLGRACAWRTLPASACRQTRSIGATLKSSGAAGALAMTQSATC